MDVVIITTVAQIVQRLLAHNVRRLTRHSSTSIALSMTLWFIPCQMCIKRFATNLNKLEHGSYALMKLIVTVYLSVKIGHFSPFSGVVRHDNDKDVHTKGRLCIIVVLIVLLSAQE